MRHSILICFILIINPLFSNASTSSIWKSFQKNKYNTLETKLENFATVLLKTPYGSLDYDVNYEVNNLDDFIADINKKEFTYSFDYFDCVTFVETVLSLTFIPDNIDNEKDFIESFKKNLKKIRYKDSKDTFLNRNHFTSIDWIPNNSNILSDITKSIYPNAKYAECSINKKNWFLYLDRTKNFLNDTNIDKQLLLNKIFINHKKSRASRNHNIFLSKDSSNSRKNPIPIGESRDSDNEESILPYIPISVFIEKYEEFYNKLPQAGIINFVRPNWNIKSSIGTNINISHQGFFFKRNNEIILIHASSSNKIGVVEISLKKYLEKVRTIKSLKGLNFLSIQSFQ